MRKIEVVAYDPYWPHRFAAEDVALRQALGSIPIAIHHIGSTSIPKMAAKPVIDILLEVSNLIELDNAQNAVEQLGYEAKGEFGIPGRRFYMKGGDKRSHHIHAFVSGDPHLVRHLAFRDYLKAHSQIARQYASLKQHLAAHIQHDIDRYCEGKDPFIKEYEVKALQWFNQRI